MTNQPPTARLDFGGFTPKSKPREDEEPKREAAAIAAAARDGFAPRDRSTVIDRRRLRRTGRNIQLNIKVTPEVKREFDLLSLDFANGSDLLSTLMATYLQAQERK
jgi:hypothetical protein